MRPLEETQRKFFAALQMPLRGRSRDSTELPEVGDGHSTDFLDTATELLKPGANLSPAESLELYHRQYWFRVLDSIEEDFPVLRKMAGEHDFWLLMEEYLLNRPSASFTLRHLGSRLADFAADWDGVDATKRRWFSAIARLEYAYMETYEAGEWVPVYPADLASATLGLQPHVRLLDLPVPADLCASWETFSPTEETPVHLAIWRGESGTAHQARLDPIEFSLLSRLRQGGTLASLFAEPTAREPEADEVSGWFATWQSRRWIAVPPAVVGEEFPVVRHREVRNVDWSRIDKMGSQARAMED